jgi:hypothetical protein
MKDIDLTEAKSGRPRSAARVEVAESKHHDAATAASADRAITCRPRLTLSVLKH